MTDLRLVVSIIGFLKEECRKSELSDDTRESLEVAIQCLQTAYDLKSEDLVMHRLQVSRSLVDIFNEANCVEEATGEDEKTSEENQVEAEKFKNLGNSLMKTEDNMEAVDAYTQAISLDGSNAVYYCNRAAAFSRLADYHAAVKDCEKAIDLDPKYSKAYGRMGLAYSSLGDNSKAIECYKKAVQLDPSNDSYQSNLKIAEEKASREEDTSQSNFPGNSLFDVADVLNNPVLRSMASRMMQDPNMINLMSGLMSSSMTDGGAASGSMESLLHAGQRLAAQMQASNPQLIEQLRQQFLSGNQPSQDSDSKDPASN